MTEIIIPSAFEELLSENKSFGVATFNKAEKLSDDELESVFEGI